MKLCVFNILGQEVAILIDYMLEAGYHTAVWDASEASTGVYLVRLETDGFNAVRKVILVK